jgi:glutathione S-transferase
VDDRDICAKTRAAVTRATAVQNLVARETIMKFYDCTTAPSPRRVRIFLAEKGLALPTVQVDLRNGEQFTPAFRALNPGCTVPVLELDSGAAITDVIAICRYLEELHPDPPLMGRSAEERAVIESWLRRIEWDGIYAAQDAFRNAADGLKGRALPGPVSLEQIPALAERGRVRLQHFFAWLDARLADHAFVCGPHFTIADISGLVAVDLAARAKHRPPESLGHLKRWYDDVSTRPSAKA